MITGAWHDETSVEAAQSVKSQQVLEGQVSGTIQ